MYFRPLRFAARTIAAWAVLVLLPGLLAAPVHAAAPRVHALVGATLVPAPGQLVEDATIVLRDGRIVAAGPSSRVPVPADARRWDMGGRWVYAGFVDPYVELEAPEAADAAEGDPGAPGPGSEHLRLRGELDMVDGLSPDPKLLEGLRKAGYTAAVVAYDGGVLRGRAAAIALGGGDPRDMLLAPRVAMAASLAGSGWGSGEYPGSVMGAVAAFRQALLDADHFRNDQAHWQRQRQRRARPAHDAQLVALQPVITGELPLLMPLRGITLPYRADIVARELGEIAPRLIFVSDNAQWQRPAMVPRRPHILTLDFPQLPKLKDEADWSQLSFDWLRQWDWAPSNAALVDSLGVPFAFTSHDLDDRGKLLDRVRLAHARGLGATSALAALTTRPASFFGLEDILGTVEAGRAGHLTVLRGGDLLDPGAVVEMVFVDGQPHWVDRPDPEAAEEDGEEAEGKDEEEEGPDPRIASREQDYRGPFASPAAVLFRGATLWTMGEDGVVQGDLLVRDGRIAAIGEGLEAPRGAMVVDATGRHLTPGLIDAHSHSATFGGINEGIPTVSSEVRIRDVVTAEDRGIYQQLAGGLTTAHVMHGSANSIGGQNATLQLKWGATPEGLLMAGVPPTIKFALGENPRGANSSSRERHYPDTRMGVEEIIRSHFAAARDYAAARAAARSDGQRPPVARDLRLDALLEVLEGDRLVHSHSYVGPEILMLMRAFEEQGAKVAVFQHVLEGYKVADEMAAHGAGASTFSDWWAYKYEVIDAIAYNAAIMDERGVLVSLNSDSGDLARRLNTEAAKAVRYGGASEEAALAMVTLNPAKQLRIDGRVGSLEPGKQADLALWSDHPLSTLAVADQTWIAGELYWDRERDRDREAQRKAEFEALLARARGHDGADDEDDGEDEAGEDDSPDEGEPGPEVSR